MTHGTLRGLGLAAVLPIASSFLGCGSGSAASGSTTTGAGGKSSHTGSGGTGGGTATPPPESDPCAGKADGSYCGGALADGDPSTLYGCASGKTATTKHCDAGCDTDHCQTPGPDPCAGAMSGDGIYCGLALAGADPDSLYGCQAGKTLWIKSCVAGCTVAPPGQPDTCKTQGADPCASATSGDGGYCGSVLQGGDANALYECSGGATASKTPCSNGCKVNPPGVPDQCAASGGCCLQQPPGSFVRGFSACGGGGDHYGIDYGTAVGTAIPAGMSGTVVSHALGFPNCWSNGCTSQCLADFNYIKIKADCGDPTTPGHDFYSYYLHIDHLAAGITDGAHVTQGEIVAYSGNSGCSSGPHIHLETVSVPAGQAAHIATCSSVNPSTRYCK